MFQMFPPGPQHGYKALYYSTNLFWFVQQSRENYWHPPVPDIIIIFLTKINKVVNKAEFCSALCGHEWNKSPMEQGQTLINFISQLKLMLYCNIQHSTIFNISLIRYQKLGHNTIELTQCSYAGAKLLKTVQKWKMSACSQWQRG